MSDKIHFKTRALPELIWDIAVRYKGYLIREDITIINV